MTTSLEKLMKSLKIPSTFGEIANNGKSQKRSNFTFQFLKKKKDGAGDVGETCGAKNIEKESEGEQKNFMHSRRA